MQCSKNTIESLILVTHLPLSVMMMEGWRELQKINILNHQELVNI